MKVIAHLLLVIVVFLLSACASTITKTDIAKIKVVGVVNNFPDSPKYTLVGTTVFNNDYDTINDTTFKSLVTNEVTTLLQNKGYQTIILSKGDAGNRIDMMIEILPRDLYNMPYTMGYGFYQRSMFGITANKISYTALNLIPVIQGSKRCSACYGESITNLPMDVMPSKWSEIGQEKQVELKNLLKADIQKAVNKAFSGIGL